MISLTMSRGTDRSWTLRITRDGARVPLPNGTKVWWEAQGGITTIRKGNAATGLTGLTVTDPAATPADVVCGEATLDLVPSDTALVPDGTVFTWAVWLLELDGLETAVLEGTLAVHALPGQTVPGA